MVQPDRVMAGAQQDYPIAPPIIVPAIPAGAIDTRCPYAQLDDLMAVIEALCPVWPDRAVHRDQSRFLL